jgi:hypothetical protein
MRRLITDISGTPVLAFAALHKIWGRTAEKTTASLQSCHAQKLV